MKQMSIFALMLAALIGVSPLFAEEAPKAEAEKTAEAKPAAKTKAAKKKKAVDKRRLLFLLITQRSRTPPA